ncbi:MAG: dihydrodipicolinate synthase family protein [Sphaerochaetaceae bacterium]|nr:dihydrodipicolinate synthase family protein [Sphaerochaetaceae bacterium]
MNAHADITHIRGVIPAMFTTFDESENLDLDRAHILVEHLLESGVDGLYITGSTGEGFLMDDGERKAFAEAVVRIVNGRTPVIVHVGAIGTKRSVELARHAKDIGADAISSVPPFYYQYGDDEIYGYYRDICEAADLPMIIYNISLAGMMSTSLVQRIASIDQVCGLKFTGTQHHEMAQLKQILGPDFMIYSGCDEMATQGLLSGADGIIGSFYNLIPDTFREIFSLCQKGDYGKAFEIQKIASRFILHLVKYGHFGVMKQLMNETGVDVGVVRRPFVHPDAAVMREIWDFIDSLEKEHGEIHMDFTRQRHRGID